MILWRGKHAEGEVTMGILSGLKGMGLENLENMDIFGGEEKKEEKKEAAPVAPKIEEKDLIFEKSYDCPVCEKKFTAKIMKSNRAKLLGTDRDLRARYEGIDPLKYDVLLCTECGYAALSRYFPTITSGQAKLIREQIGKNFRKSDSKGEIYSYEDALARYKLALVNAVVKKAKTSEKAYICLKSAWLIRGYRENLQEQGTTDGKMLEELIKQEAEYLENAYKGFVEARQSEDFPLCGMDEMTIDYLIAALAVHCKKYDVASKLVASILTTANANPRIKDKARLLKEQIVEDLKKK